jgi:hypothetical protein
MFAFLALLFVLVAVYFFTSKSNVREKFTAMPSHQVNIPVNKVPSPPAQIVDSTVKPANLPGSLPSAPYEQVAAMSPLPYQDPAQMKANRQQLVDTLELMKGFLAFEAQEISEKSDPAIQLPLNTLRSDFKRIQDEVFTLNRNPGLQPNITMLDLSEIEANLGYLQDKVRLMGAAGVLQGPIYEFTKRVNVETKGQNQMEGFENMTGESGQVATADDLKQFVIRIKSEIVRLSASGTNDPIIVARILGLTQMQQNINDILAQVESGALMSNEIPIMKKDIQKALPVLSKPNEPLPQVIRSLGLPIGLGNMLPSNLQNNPEVKTEISKLLDKYAKQIIDGVSASFTVKYTSEREGRAIADENGLNRDKQASSSVDQTGFPSASDLSNINGPQFNIQDQGKVTDQYAQKPVEAGRGPAHFDWKTRSKQIEEQVKKRGLKLSDFGIMPEGTKVSNEFSWKGYARMICSRLQATMDPALPETCGCPPMDWSGWRIANY